MAKNDIVTFQMPDGTTISNDPRFHAQKYQGEENEGQAEQSGQPVSPEQVATNENTEPSGGDDEETKSLDDMTADELKAEVKRLADEEDIEVDTSGVKNKAQLIERIKAATSSNDS